MSNHVIDYTANLADRLAELDVASIAVDAPAGYGSGTDYTITVTLTDGHTTTLKAASRCAATELANTIAGCR